MIILLRSSDYKSNTVIHSKVIHSKEERKDRSLINNGSTAIVRMKKQNLINSMLSFCVTT